MKTIPVALQAHYDQPATTTCLLTRVACKDGTVIGFTSLDADVTYDDGLGSVVYRASNGFEMDRMQATADLAVDNTELRGWVSADGITEAQIRSGLFDYSRVRIYRVNYLDLAAGHEIIAAGTAGETKFGRGGFSIEFRSLTQQLKQPISNVYSLTCRAKFGSQPIGTGGEQPEERFPCGKAWTWVAGTVSAVDALEPDRVFTVTGLSDVVVPGVIEMLTGANAGAQMEVDAYAAGELTLALPLPYAPAPGDTFRYRADCSKKWDDDAAGCLFHWGTERPLHFRGEPYIPVDGKAGIPGAEIVRA
jgi:uncharacterized phage protein (TIGR02218 family)